MSYRGNIWTAERKDSQVISSDVPYVIMYFRRIILVIQALGIDQ